MKKYIGYIRVSTVKQGTQGVSLNEQRDAISRYAERNGLLISFWLEEMETAAKQGRPVFAQALKLLRTRKADGIILHKLDRGARNLRDWNAIGELSDEGIEVHFVNESLDLRSRGGRLSADIQAVVAADYIRNLKEELRKGFYGRLKQGFYPLAAPLGYIDRGKAKAKEIDPVQGPLVRRMFELYAGGRYSLNVLKEEMHRLGLRNRRGGKVTKSGISHVLNNPFYIGVMHIAKTGESFPGVHKPLIENALFDRVRAVLSGKFRRRVQRHAFLFRQILACAKCEYSLIGELQKGHVYYRCHTPGCKSAVREEAVEESLRDFLDRVSLSEREVALFRAKLSEIQTAWAGRHDEQVKSLRLRESQSKERMNRLTDAFLDGAIDKTTFNARKESLLTEQSAIQDNLTKLSASEAASTESIEKILELAKTASLNYRLAEAKERRDLIKLLTSNRSVDGKSICFKPSFPFHELKEGSNFKVVESNEPHLELLGQFWKN